jgi:hypothetical protein
LLHVSDENQEVAEFSYEKYLQLAALLSKETPTSLLLRPMVRKILHSLPLFASGSSENVLVMNLRLLGTLIVLGGVSSIEADPHFFLLQFSFLLNFDATQILQFSRQTSIQLSRQILANPAQIATPISQDADGNFIRKFLKNFHKEEVVSLVGKISQCIAHFGNPQVFASVIFSANFQDKTLLLPGIFLLGQMVMGMRPFAEISAFVPKKIFATLDKNFRQMRRTEEEGVEMLRNLQEVYQSIEKFGVLGELSNSELVLIGFCMEAITHLFRNMPEHVEKFLMHFIFDQFLFLGTYETSSKEEEKKKNS